MGVENVPRQAAATNSSRDTPHDSPARVLGRTHDGLPARTPLMGEGLAVRSTHEVVGVVTEPCRNFGQGYIMGHPCDDCGHPNVVHTLATGNCAICEVREELGLPSKRVSPKYASDKKR